MTGYRVAWARFLGAPHGRVITKSSINRDKYAAHIAAQSTSMDPAKRVLIVEDDAHIAELMGMHLQD